MQSKMIFLIFHPNPNLKLTKRGDPKATWSYSERWLVSPTTFNHYVVKMVILFKKWLFFDQNCHFNNHLIQRKQFIDGGLSRKMASRLKARGRPNWATIGLEYQGGEADQWMELIKKAKKDQKLLQNSRKNMIKLEPWYWISQQIGMLHFSFQTKTDSILT